MHDAWILRGKGKFCTHVKLAAKTAGTETTLAEVEGVGGKPHSYCNKSHVDRPRWKQINDEKKAYRAV